MEFMSVSHYLMYCACPRLTKTVGADTYSVFETKSGESSAYTLNAARRRLRTAGTREGLTVHVHEVADEYNALLCKFSDERNEDLRRVLLATHDAALYVVRRGCMTRPFYTLMRVRERLRNATKVYSL